MSDRPALVDAASEFLATPPRHPAETTLRTALADLVEGRYRGGAAAVKRVHDLRQRLLDDDRPLAAVADAEPGPWDDHPVGKLAEYSAPSDQGRLLYQLVRAYRPEEVVELGTNIGISAAYIAAGLAMNGSGHLSTLEASGLRLAFARQNFAQLDRAEITTIEGYFDDTLPPLLDSLDRVDLAFVDGNHRRQATLHYFESLRRHGTGVVVFDDIRWSDEMGEAWSEIRQSPDLAAAVDLGRTGIVVLSAGA